MTNTNLTKDEFDEISKQKAQVTSDYFALLARKDNKVFIVLEDIDEALDNTGNLEAKKEVNEWDSSKVRPVGKNLAEEIE